MLLRVPAAKASRHQMAQRGLHSNTAAESSIAVAQGNEQREREKDFSEHRSFISVVTASRLMAVDTSILSLLSILTCIFSTSPSLLPIAHAAIHGKFFFSYFVTSSTPESNGIRKLPSLVILSLMYKESGSRKERNTSSSSARVSVRSVSPGGHLPPERLLLQMREKMKTRGQNERRVCVCHS